MEGSVWVEPVDGETKGVCRVVESRHHVYAAGGDSGEESVHRKRRGGSNLRHHLRNQIPPAGVPGNFLNQHVQIRIIQESNR